MFRKIKRIIDRYLRFKRFSLYCIINSYDRNDLFNLQRSLSALKRLSSLIKFMSRCWHSIPKTVVKAWEHSFLSQRTGLRANSSYNQIKGKKRDVKLCQHHHIFDMPSRWLCSKKNLKRFLWRCKRCPPSGKGRQTEKSAFGRSRVLHDNPSGNLQSTPWSSCSIATNQACSCPGKFFSRLWAISPREVTACPKWVAFWSMPQQTFPCGDRCTCRPGI